MITSRKEIRLSAAKEDITRVEDDLGKVKDIIRELDTKVEGLKMYSHPDFRPPA